MTQYYPDLGSASDWLKSCFNQSEALPRSRECRDISVVFLCPFLRRHFAGKPVVASRNVGCFFQACSLRVIWHFSLVFHHPFFSLLLAFLPYFWIDGDNAVRPEQRTVSASEDGECKAHARKTGTVRTKVEKNYKINKILSPEEIFPPIFV